MHRAVRNRSEQEPVCPNHMGAAQEPTSAIKWHEVREPGDPYSGGRGLRLLPVHVLTYALDASLVICMDLFVLE